jgi:hypothetical protein
MNRRSFVPVFASLVAITSASQAHAQAEPAAPAPGAAPVAAAAPAPAQGSQGNAAEEEQEVRKANNVIFLELGGNGLVYSINYERIFGDSDFSVRAGFSYISLGASSSNTSTASVSLLTFPVLGNYYVGSANHKLQLGAGLTFMQASASAGSSSGSLVTASGFVPAPTLVIGYRYIPAKGGFAFSVGFTPFVIPGNDRVLFPWAGMSFGGVF